MAEASAASSHQNNIRMLMEKMKEFQSDNSDDTQMCAKVESKHLLAKFVDHNG